RRRLAPIAERTAISRERPAVRARTRLAEFAQAMSRTRPTTAMRRAVKGTTKIRNSGGIPVAGRTAAVHPLLLLGYALASCSARTHLQAPQPDFCRVSDLPRGGRRVQVSA